MGGKAENNGASKCKNGPSYCTVHRDSPKC